MAIRIKMLIVCIALFSMPFVRLAAQEDDEYRMEIGGALGGSFYMGDANYTKPFMNLGPAGGVIGRFILNPRMDIKMDLLVGRISGDTNNFDNKYPQNGQASFKRTVFDFGGQFEYNFWAYGTGHGYRGGHRFTPYILGGVGLTYAPAPAEAVFTANLPVGLGVKYKLGRRLNIGCEFAMHFSLSDKLDVTNKEGFQLNDPYGISSVGIKNKDSYAFLLFYLTYDISPKCKDCNN